MRVLFLRCGEKAAHEKLIVPIVFLFLKIKPVNFIAPFRGMKKYFDAIKTFCVIGTFYLQKILSTFFQQVGISPNTERA